MPPPAKRDVVIAALQFRPPPYVPWAWKPTQQCGERLRAHLGTDDLGPFLDSHFCDVGPEVGHFEHLGGDRWRDLYGVVWDRSIDKDIGCPAEWPIHEPGDLDAYTFPDVAADAWYDGVAPALAAAPDRFRRYMIGFSLYERAWTMHGLTETLTDMVARPGFIEDLLDAITEHNLVQIRRALEFDVDAVRFGDDYGMQTGLIMGTTHWRHFIKPRLARMFEPVREAGKVVFLHSCGCVTELLDDLVEIGLDAFNPFQPEVMDVFEVKRRYHGRLAFFGGMSVQRILPFGSTREVREEAARLLAMGAGGGYIFSPSHDVPYDVPPENLVAMMDVVRSQAGLGG